MITIKDVADRAKVSITTVSHVVNGTRFVSEKSRERVLQAIEDLKYVPSAVARSLKSNRTHTIGLIISNSINPFFAEVARGIEDACYESSFNVVLCNTDDNLKRQSRYVRLLIEKQVDGLIILSPGSSVDLADVLNTVNVPHVEVDREIEDVRSDMVQVDHRFGAVLAVEHLLALGHRRIGCITGPMTLSPARLRLEGYRATLLAAGVEFDQRLVVEADFSSAGGHRAMCELLSRPERPTAVFASNDLIAMGAICAAAETGLDVPGDMSICGFDDIALAAYTNPPLTTVAQPMHELGRLAARVLIDRIEEPHGQPFRHMLKPVLRERRSTGPMKGTFE